MTKTTKTVTVTERWWGYEVRADHELVAETASVPEAMKIAKEVANGRRIVKVNFFINF